MLYIYIYIYYKGYFALGMRISFCIVTLFFRKIKYFFPLKFPLMKGKMN